MLDALVVGGGLVGAAAALALARAGYEVLLLEAHAPQPVDSSEQGPWDARVYAVSPGNVQWLEQLGAWSRVPAQRRQAITRMDVRGDGNGRLCFDAYEAQASALAWIVENGQLQRALWQALELAGVPCVTARPTALQLEAGQARVELDNGQVLTARLLVAADGAGSWTRTQAGISLAHKAYGQRGVVANFSCERRHDGVARQWFSQQDILAWLPLPGQRMSMVWSAPDALADELLGLEPAALCQRVAAAGGHELGALQLLTAAQAFPLRRQRASRVIGQRLVLVGDAAHTVHPLAGQGVNLGFNDVRELERQLLRGGQADCGSSTMLRRYERARAEQVLLMQSSCDALHGVFNRAPSWLAPWRNLGMSAVNRAGWLKRQLIAQAMT